MRILALITARGASKRLPGKNIRPLGGKPLLVWTIESAKGVKGVCDILVSTDDQKIADVAQEGGGLVPWLRPAGLATDTAPSIDVALHALDWYEDAHGPVDGLMLLQPTSPFRRAETIQNAIGIFLKNGRRPVIGVSPAASHPAWCYRIEQDTLLPYSGNVAEGTPHRSQDLPPAYVLNGAMYLAEPAYLRKARTFLGGDSCPLLMDNPAESLDIDTAYDFLVAECIAAAMDNGAAA
jgi:CMP-N,N'-diacetyllegionaminic acid synthase